MPCTAARSVAAALRYLAVASAFATAAAIWVSDALSSPYRNQCYTITAESASEFAGGRAPSATPLLFLSPPITPLTG